MTSNERHVLVSLRRPVLESQRDRPSERRRVLPGCTRQALRGLRNKQSGHTGHHRQGHREHAEGQAHVETAKRVRTLLLRPGSHDPVGSLLVALALWNRNIGRIGRSLEVFLKQAAVNPASVRPSSGGDGGNDQDDTPTTTDPPSFVRFRFGGHRRVRAGQLGSPDRCRRRDRSARRQRGARAVRRGSSTGVHVW